MSKDSYWFKHDDSAGRGLKMRKMSHIYGHWGKGIYWDVVEILRSQDKYMFSSDESSLSLLSDLIGCKDESKFINWFNDCIRIGLFEIVNKSFFLCPPLTENMKVWEAKKDNGKKGGRPSNNTKNKANQKLNESELKANQKHKIIEDKIIEDKRREENIYIPEFSEFLKYAKEKKPKVCVQALELKYEAWKMNDWKDGNNSKIKNWKSKLLNTLPYIKENNYKSPTDITL